MNISVVGTGYVGLVTGVCLSDIGHKVVCVDIDQNKVDKMSKGISPIYEPGLDELMVKNINEGRLSFTVSHEEGFSNADVIFIAVGTPQDESGAADLKYIEQAAMDIATQLKRDAIVVVKSTVPVGTNEIVKGILNENKNADVQIDVASNPEFLREGSAVYDTFNADRIVIGSEKDGVAIKLEELYKPLNCPVFHTNIRSAEMIKYASNVFLATKISFINEVANLCDLLGADIESVSKAMGMDDRIGNKFLNAGIGYGGSCFPKDVSALNHMANTVEYDAKIIKAITSVNNKQKLLLVEKMKKVFDSISGVKVALLGLAFKPNTDDMREAPSIYIAQELVKLGAEITAYDPIAIENAKKVLPSEVKYVDSAEKALADADVALIVTEWDEVKSLSIDAFKDNMKTAIVIDGRNCFDSDVMSKEKIEYYSIGRPKVKAN
ncbi:UDP-glucose dehydrogenase family protein [Sutcliffiella halmapala]